MGEKNRLLRNVCAVMAMLFVLCSCAEWDRMNNTEKGGLTGAGTGAVIGQALGRSPEATILGAIIGGTIGVLIGNDMDQRDRQRVARAYEYTPDGQTYAWRNPDSGDSYRVMPERTYDGGRCRDAVVYAVIDGHERRTHTTACRNHEGRWVLQ